MINSKKNKITKDKSSYYWAVARITLGLTFLWAFFDKLLGLGFATCRDPKTENVILMCEKSWIAGASPTSGFLKFATKGPLAEFYQSLAGHPVVDLLFMAGLLLIGLALITGIGIKIATASGALMMIMMWSSALLPENNPLIDEHIIYSIVLLGILASNKNQKWGLGKWWSKQRLVKKIPLLE